MKKRERKKWKKHSKVRDNPSGLITGFSKKGWGWGEKMFTEKFPNWTNHIHMKYKENDTKAHHNKNA